MSSVDFLSLSGEGHAQIATDWIPVTELDAFITTAGPKMRYIGAAFPRAVRYAGHVGLSVMADTDFAGDLRELAMFDFTIDRESRGFLIPQTQGGFEYFTSVWWQLAPGVVIDITVWW